MPNDFDNITSNILGSFFQGFIYSIAESEYAPGTVAGPRIAKNGFDLPSARKLSTTVTKTSANQDRRDGVSTVLVMQMGQFIDHDITHTPNHAKVEIV